MKSLIQFVSSILEAALIFFCIALCVLLCAAAFSPKSHADCETIYAKIGTGYKIHSVHTVVINDYTYKIDNNSPLSARIELGSDCGNLTYGIAHYSQWLDGPPLNSRKEYSRTEIFVDYKFEWSL